MPPPISSSNGPLRATAAPETGKWHSHRSGDFINIGHSVTIPVLPKAQGKMVSELTQQLSEGKENRAANYTNPTPGDRQIRSLRQPRLAEPRLPETKRITGLIPTSEEKHYGNLPSKH